MTYLSLYLCAKLGVAIPYLLGGRIHNQEFHATKPATPPIYLTFIALLPLTISTYVAGTRYSDFRHHGFDILFGSLMGFTFAVLSFRFYHSSNGRTFGARSMTKAFWSGQRSEGWGVSQEDDGGKKRDLEFGVGDGRGDSRGGKDRMNGSSSGGGEGSSEI